MSKLELLAPAQNIECAMSAINSGADAIYIGAKSFGARKNAGNSIETIKKIVDYAHLFNVKVYVTVNTIISDDELAECEKLIWELYEIKVDAIIVQDLGILNLNLPPIALHASTQCDNRTADKVNFLKEIGFRRVILARELPHDKIEKISKSTDVELEHFIHGALCVCYSGQCYMSEFIGGRSANRGECAQSCRLKYSLVNSKNEIILRDKYLLSLKDNNLSKHLDKLIKAGVVSFKIEGRLKDSNYVKNTVLYYHNLLKKYQRQGQGIIISDFEPDIYKTFNRGFVDDYLFNKKDNIYNFDTPKSIGEYLGEVISINENHLVLKTNKKVNAQDGLCYFVAGILEGCLVNKVENVKSGVKVFANKKVKLKKGDKVYRNIDFEFNKILQNSKTTRKLEVEFVVSKDSITVFDKNKNKETYFFENFEKANDTNKMKENYEKSLRKTNETPFIVSKISYSDNDLSFVPVSKLNEIRRKLLEDLQSKILSRYKVKKASLIDASKFPMENGDYRLNVHNKLAEEFYEICGCNVLEKSFEREKKKNKQYELMRMKHCLKKATLGCDSKEDLFLIDQKGVKYPLFFDCKNCEMVVLSPENK